MASPPLGSARCPVMVGRESELTAVLAALADEDGRVLVVSGEAGIGKSRLVGEAQSHALARSRRVIAGQCFEQDRAVAYAPIIDLLRRCLATDPDAVVAASQPFGTVLGLLLPELGADRHGGGLASESGGAAGPSVGEALARTLVRLIGSRSALVIVEDLHWADDASLDVLLRLSRQIRGQPVVLGLTYRDDDATSTLVHVLAELEREHLATEIRLSRLAAAGVDAMLRAIFALPRPTPAQLLYLATTLTDGNPFLVEELAKTIGQDARLDADLDSMGWPRIAEVGIPRTVEDTVRRRLMRIGPTARRVLDVAAVAGRRFDFAQQREVAGLDEPELLAAIKELVAAQFVVEESADRFAFRHALIREAVYGPLLARERRDIHRTIARQIERGGPATPDGAADLAYHYYEAEDYDKAATYGQRAADAAVAIGAPRVAIHQANRALAALARLGIAPSPALHRVRGLAHETVGEFNRARVDHEKAPALARTAGDAEAEWQALVDLGTLATVGDYATAGAFFASAAELARAFPDRTSYARTLNRLGNWYANTGRVLKAVPAHREALAILQAADCQPGAAETLDLLGMACGLAGDLRAAAAYYEQAIVAFRRLGDRRGELLAVGGRLAWGYSGHFAETVASPVPDLAAALRDADEGLRLARMLEWPAMEAFIHLAIGPDLAIVGLLGHGMAHLKQAERIADEIGHRQWLAATKCHLSRLYLDALDGDRAGSFVQDGLVEAQVLGSELWLAVAFSYLAMTHLLRRQPGQAEAALAAVFDPDRPPGSLAERMLKWTWGEVFLAQGDARAALRVADALLDSVPGGPADHPIPALLKLKGEALLTLGQPATAAESLTAADRGAIARQARPLRWQILAVLADALKALGCLDTAITVARDAHAVVASMAADIGDDEMRGRFLRAASAAIPIARPPTPLQAAKHAFGGLTERERDVAVLVAQGRSNAEIAAQLSIGRRTVETHVGHILAKLDLTTRAQVAAWTVDHGLINGLD